MDRTKFVERQKNIIDEAGSLTDEPKAWECFHALCIDTYDFVNSMGARLVLNFSPWPESAFNALRCGSAGMHSDGTAIPLSPELIGRWTAWNKEYYEIRMRNPRLELRDTMQIISESHDASSWPAGYERRIQRWVDANDASAKPPFDDRSGIVTPAFFSRLRELRQLCSGWIYYDEKRDRLVFLGESDWQKVAADQDVFAAHLKRRLEPKQT